MKEKVKVEPSDLLFAKIMEIATLIALAFIILTGIAYFAGIREFVEIRLAIENWDKAAAQFWEATKGITPRGYSWFIRNLTYMDSWSIVSIILLALTPMLCIIAIIFKIKPKYKILGVILLTELIAAIIVGPIGIGH